MRLNHVMICCSVTLLVGCTAHKNEGEAADDSATWWEEDVDDTPDDTGNKPDDCPDDFDPVAPCEGDWATTLCIQEGLFWWCEGGGVSG
jgi:hypothetical protein